MRKKAWYLTLITSRIGESQSLIGSITMKIELLSDNLNGKEQKKKRDDFLKKNKILKLVAQRYTFV